MSNDLALLVVDGLQGLEGPSPVRDAIPAERPRPVALSRDDILEKLRAWEVDYIGGQAAATVRAVRSDWNQYLAWCEGTHTPPLPLPVARLVAFVNSAIDRSRKRSTIDRYLSTISLIHEAAELPNPVKQPIFRRKYKACIKRLVKLGRNVAEPAAALSCDDIDAILATLNLERMVDLRDAALITLAADTMCRESELVAVCVEHFGPNDIDGAISLDVCRSKTNQEGQHDYRYVSPETLERIERWKERAGLTSGPIFVPVSGRKKLVRKDGEPTPAHMLPQEVARIFRKRAIAANLGPKVSNVSGHSTRIGGANELVLAGEDLRAIADAGGWKDVKQVLHYTQASRAGIGAMARLRAARKTAKERHSIEAPADVGGVGLPARKAAE